MTKTELKEGLYEHKDAMYRLALRYLRNQADAEDVLQDVFVKCWEQSNDIHIDQSLKAYLMTMTRNRCLDKLKKHSNKYETNHELLDYQHPKTEMQLDEKEQIEIVHQLVNKLPEIQQSIFHLRQVEGMEYDEISKITGQSVINIRTQLSRMRKRLKNELEKIINYEYA